MMVPALKAFEGFLEYNRVVFHARDHEFLRASFLSAHRHRCLSIATQKIQARVVAIFIYSWLVPDRTCELAPYCHVPEFEYSADEYPQVQRRLAE
jgi:hypothetical protein